MVTFNLKENEGDLYASVNGSPEELVLLIAGIMLNDKNCANLILAATEVYEKTIKKQYYE
jgi:hypothetical protein